MRENLIRQSKELHLNLKEDKFVPSGCEGLNKHVGMAQCTAIYLINAKYWLTKKYIDYNLQKNYLLIKN